MTRSGSVMRRIDCDALRDQARTAAPFPHVVIEDFLEADFADEVLRTWPSYDEAVTIGESFRSINERNKVQVTNSGQFPEALRELEQALAAPGFVANVSSIFGIPDLLADPELVGAGLHQTGSGGRLDVHVDFNYIQERKLHRRLNILVFFNKGWLPQWGGQLELWNSDVSVCIRALDPMFNRCVIFETSDISYHGVTEVTCPKAVVRRSFAGYYYTKAPPVHWTGQSHSTIFKARPGESLKNRAMAVKHLSDVAKGKLRNAIRR